MTNTEISKDLNRLEMEIDFYKEQAGVSIWEIGRRLNHIKENNLVRGEFLSWLKDRNIEQTAATRMMKIARELPKSATLPTLGVTALYLIASLPADDRDKEHITSVGEAKKPQDMTVKELRELTTSSKTQAPSNDVISTDTEVMKADIIKDSAIEKENNRLLSRIEKLQDELKFTQDKMHSVNEQYQMVLEREDESRLKANELDQLKADINNLAKKKDTYVSEMASIKNILELKEQVTLLLSKISPLLYLEDLNAVKQNKVVSDNYLSLIDKVQNWCNDMYQLFNQPIIIDAQVIDADII